MAGESMSPEEQHIRDREDEDVFRGIKSRAQVKREREKRAARRRGTLAAPPSSTALDPGPDPDALDFARDMEDGLVLSAEEWQQAAADGVDIESHAAMTAWVHRRQA